MTSLGCAPEVDESPELGEAVQAVNNGVASSRSAVVLVEAGITRCGGVAVGPRTVISLSDCDGANPVVVPTPTGSTPVAVTNITQGPLVPIPGGGQVGISIFEVGSDLPVTPAAIGPAPALGDDLILAGYGTTNGVGERSEGPITVDSVGTEIFVAIGVNGVEACVSDAAAFDAQDQLVGFGVFGDVMGNGCRNPVTYYNVDALGLGGVGGGGMGGAGGAGTGGGVTSSAGGAGMGGAGMGGAGPSTTAGVGGGTTSGAGGSNLAPNDDDGGCGCRLAGRPSPSEGGVAGLVLGLALALRRRRRS